MISSILLTDMTHAQTPSTPAAETDALYELGAHWFEQYAPAEIREEFEFPSRAQWDDFARRLQRDMDGLSMEALAAYATEARAALPVLQVLPGYEDIADWLRERLDEIEGAQQVTRSAARGLTPAAPSRPKASTSALSPSVADIPYYDLWLDRVRDRPLPSRAAALMPRLRAAFEAEGMPPELAWLAEAESSFNPAARSPVGARGLFQFMPETAESLGLSTSLPDERTDPDKSAQAAARYLKMLHARFGNWPLTFAAYNAGQGRVSRTLAAEGATDFAAISHALPAETRMYVPKVCALIATRAGVPPEKLAPPR